MNFNFKLAPSEIWHRNKSRMIQVSGSIGKLSLEEAANKAMKAMEGVSFPKGYYSDIGGDYQDLVTSQKAFKRAIVITIFLVFVVMACIFESLYQPFIIMFTVLLSVFGAIAGLIISNSVVSSGVLIGMLMLGGIVVNNGIILISSMNRCQFFDMSMPEILEYIISISKTRIRPVFMTTFTTVGGLVPMVLDKSESAVMWRPFAITVIGGLITSTVLTLFVVPVIYYSALKVVLFFSEEVPTGRLQALKK
jgi:hydrophobic/amphiphilic exporter-1 (mainly G- bacteria), HAE1 family